MIAAAAGRPTTARRPGIARAVLSGLLAAAGTLLGVSWEELSGR